MLPRQRPPQVVWRGFNPDQSAEFIDANLELGGFDDYIGCSTQEMDRRPVPHTFGAEQVQPMADLYTKWADRLFRWIFKQIRPPTQTYNRNTRMGYPYFTIRPDKLTVLLPEFARFLEGDDETLRGAYTINNIRMQPESRKKKRVFRFLTPRGEVYEEEVGEAGRMRKGRVSSRTRLVFNQPISNLLKQILDTAIHNVFMSHQAYHHNMNALAGSKEKGDTYAMDVSHFERHVGVCVRIRADIIGGLYKHYAEKTLNAPFLVYADDFKTPYFLWPRKERGQMEQLGSGDSAVAPIGKEVLTCVYAEFFSRVLHVDEDNAIDTVAKGGIPGKFEIKNYGDDNFISGDRSLREEFVAFASTFLDVAQELPARFLGWVYDDIDGWHLPLKSYVLNVMLAERAPGTRFRKYAELGIVKRREIYGRMGNRHLRETYIPAERALWAKFGIDEADLQATARKQENELANKPMLLSPNIILDKRYLLSDAEKAAMPEEYGTVGPNYTATALRELVGPDWLQFLP